MEEDSRKNNLWALLLTLLITGGTLALLLHFTLRYEQDPNLPDLTQLAQDSILFGGEYVMLGNTMDLVQNDLMDQESADPSASPDEGDDPDINADDLEDAGEANHKTPPVVTQKTESPHKVKEQPKETEPKKSGPVKENEKKVEKPKAQDRKAEAQETKSKNAEQKSSTSNATSNRVKNAFGNGNGNGGGQQGSASGNSNQGVLAGKPGISGLVGYTLDYWAKPVPNSKWSGRVTVRVTVNPRGQVIKANAISATGDLASHPEVRRACEQAALKSRFSVPKNTMTEGIGTVTYIWH